MEGPTNHEPAHAEPDDGTLPVEVNGCWEAERKKRLSGFLDVFWA